MRNRTGDDQTAHKVVDGQEPDVGPQLPERLGPCGECIVGDELVLNRFGVFAHRRHHRRTGEFLGLFLALDGLVEAVPQDGEPDSEPEADQ